MSASNPFAEAEGYLELDLFEEAWFAIDELAEDARASAPALRIRMRAAAGLERWDMVEILAKSLQYGEAMHREEAAHAFHALAREYLARGDREKAREMIKAAVAIWPDQRLQILDDPRLKGLL